MARLKRMPVHLHIDRGAKHERTNRQGRDSKGQYDEREQKLPRRERRARWTRLWREVAES